MIIATSDPTVYDVEEIKVQVDNECYVVVPFETLDEPIQIIPRPTKEQLQGLGTIKECE